MTLLEMIKKWEKMKAKIVAESGSRPTGDYVAGSNIVICRTLLSVYSHAFLFISTAAHGRKH